MPLLAALVAVAVPATAQTPAGRQAAAGYVIRNATIVPVAGPRIPRGTIVLRNGIIEAVGVDVRVPSGVEVIDGTGLFVYPGLVDAGTRLGLTEIGSVPGGEDTQELGDFNPQNDALSAVNLGSEVIPTVRLNGVTTALTSARGGVVSGQSALIDLAGWTPEEMAVVPRAGMVFTYPRVQRGFGGRARPEAELREEVERQTRGLRTFLADARAYAEIRARLASGGGAPGRTNLAMEAMVPVVRGESPAIFDVETEQQIRGVLALADSFGLRVILRGAREAWRLADTLAARRIPVIVGPLTAEPPDDDPYDAIYAMPGALARAGVLIAFQTASGADARNVAYNAALATAYGLDPEEALRALTVNPARIFGVQERYGTLERGRVANVIVTTGDPLDARTGFRHVFIRGQLVPRTDRHNRLYDLYRDRPRP